jgi:hypothetical protein
MKNISTKRARLVNLEMVLAVRCVCTNGIKYDNVIEYTAIDSANLNGLYQRGIPNTYRVSTKDKRMNSAAKPR